MIHILFMILKALGILLLVLLFLVLLIVCTVLFLPFCYRAQVLKEEEGFDVEMGQKSATEKDSQGNG